MRTLVTIVVLLLAGCQAHHRKPETIKFRGCKVVETDGVRVGCVCSNIIWAADAKDSNTKIALCAK